MGAFPVRAEAAAKPASWMVNFQPARLVNGSPVVFRVKAPAGVRSLHGKWLDHEVSFRWDAPRKTWYALAGVSLETQPGAYPLSLQASLPDGRESTFQQKIPVRAGKYPSIAIRVAGKYTEPDPEQLRQIAEDKKVKQEAFRSLTPQAEWAGTFSPPVSAPISDVFGTRRTFNGKVQSVHQGLDYGVPAGTPVLAINRGTVLLARPLYFEGNCVVIDHGQGLLSLYLHLSEIQVKEGDAVERGHMLGLSGSTGRATGPHLHIAVRWQGTYLSPAVLLALGLPAAAPAGQD
ncbi:MAG: M23 family metallopeptidase [Acidobacteria bacterium]|nr:M23 family metallopeptidase [Acidobacteriota bacterium]